MMVVQGLDKRGLWPRTVGGAGVASNSANANMPLSRATLVASEPRSRHIPGARRFSFGALLPCIPVDTFFANFPRGISGSTIQPHWGLNSRQLHDVT